MISIFAKILTKAQKRISRPQRDATMPGINEAHREGKTTYNRRM